MIKKGKIKRLGKKVLAICLSFIAFTMMSVTALADGVEGQNKDYVPYVALGADLKDTERKTVLELLGVTEEQLKTYDVVNITNEDEHKNLGSYLTDQVIGKRALSSVFVKKMEKGKGIGVTTHNITYCTSGMYCNALITAGITDAEVVVAGPFKITGTAALVGAMKAYEVMTGQQLSEQNMDAATNELVVTGKVADSTGDAEKTEQLVALVKQKIFEDNLASKEDITNAVDEASKTLNLTLSEKDKQQIIDLMDKIKGLDLDVNTLKSQAAELYNKLASLNIDTDNLAEKVGDAFANIFTAIVDFIKGLFS